MYKCLKTWKCTVLSQYQTLGWKKIWFHHIWCGWYHTQPLLMCLRASWCWAAVGEGIWVVPDPATAHVSAGQLVLGGCGWGDMGGSAGRLWVRGYGWYRPSHCSCVCGPVGAGRLWVRGYGWYQTQPLLMCLRACWCWAAVGEGIWVVPDPATAHVSAGQLVLGGCGWGDMGGTRPSHCSCVCGPVGAGRLWVRGYGWYQTQPLLMCLRASWCWAAVGEGIWVVPDPATAHVSAGQLVLGGCGWGDMGGTRPSHCSCVCGPVGAGRLWVRGYGWYQTQPLLVCLRASWCWEAVGEGIWVVPDPATAHVSAGQLVLGSCGWGDMGGTRPSHCSCVCGPCWYWAAVGEGIWVVPDPATAHVFAGPVGTGPLWVRGYGWYQTQPLLTCLRALLVLSCCGWGDMGGTRPSHCGPCWCWAAVGEGIWVVPDPATAHVSAGPVGAGRLWVRGYGWYQTQPLLMCLRALLVLGGCGWGDMGGTRPSHCSCVCGPCWCWAAVGEGIWVVPDPATAHVSAGPVGTGPLWVRGYGWYQTQPLLTCLRASWCWVAVGEGIWVVPDPATAHVSAVLLVLGGCGWGDMGGTRPSHCSRVCGAVGAGRLWVNIFNR